MTALRLLRQKQILRNQAKPLNAVPVLAAPLLAKQLRLSRQARQAATGSDISHYISGFRRCRNCHGPPWTAWLLPPCAAPRMP